jgi:predicted DNA-binding protein (MmcQ/YjbR family)
MAVDRAKVAEAVREFALGLPGAREEFPWGERVAKVGSKIFVFLGRSDAEKAAASPAKARHVGEPGGFSVGVKLPWSAGAVLKKSFARPSDYGLGKRGWVTLSFGPGERLPLPQLQQWIEESYRAVAPKSLVGQLDESPPGVRSSIRRKQGRRR